MAKETKGLRDMGPNIPAAKQAEYDRQVKCKGSAGVPSMAADTNSTAGLKGLGDVSRLRDCGPGDR